MAEPAVLESALAGLRAAWGVQFTLVAPVLRSLASGEPASVDRLVRESGLSHRSTADVLRALEPWLRAAGDERVLVEPARAAVEAAGGAGRPALDDAGLLETMTRLVGGAPGRRRELDHVVATPATCVARARFLVERYALAGAHVLCVGDHDLTSLAVALAAPEARVSAVDVDDEVLAYVDRSARALDRRVTCHFADLRLGLPRSLRESADVAFTDPPYTPEGVRLFAARGCEALRRDDRSRLLLCYGYGERQSGLALRVQSGLHALRLVYEAVLPGFNRYLGAQAIGSASALHVLRPAAATWKAVEREPPTPANIYSHGRSAVEAGRSALASPIVEALGDAELLALPDLWRLHGRHATGAPAHRPALPPAVAVSVLDAPALAVRVLLTNRCRRLLLVAPEQRARALLGGEPWLARLLGAAYSLRSLGRDGAVAVVEAVAREDEPGDASLRLARDVVRHPAGGVGNVLREALVRVAGGRLTRNQARELVEAHVDVDSGSRAAELPLHGLRAVAEALPRLAEAVAAS